MKKGVCNPPVACLFIIAKDNCPPLLGAVALLQQKLVTISLETCDCQDAFQQ